jgi:diguanylate cyclase (GGDEF)-like protein/PAS domain S-box-containing protein
VTHWIQSRHFPLKSGDRVTGVFAISSNITQHAREKNVHDRLNLAANVFAHATEAFMVMDLSTKIVEVNDAFTRITGYEREEVLGKSPRFLRSPSQGEDFYEGMWGTLTKSGRWRGEAWGQAKDGRLFAAVGTLTTVYQRENQPQYFVALFADITPVKEQEQKLEHVSKHDPLTGLPNRVLMAEKVGVAMAESRESKSLMAAVHLDVDNFKAVNDQYGRATADKLLVALAERISESLPPGSSLGRLGGDEFLVILPGLTSEEAVSAGVQRMLRSAERPFTIGEAVLQVSATTGVASYPQSQEVNADQLVRQADQAMYEAKLAGKARMQIFDPVRASSVRGLNEELHRVSEGLKTGEFVLYFQPKVNMATGDVMGAEALVRWQHPQRGLLYPDAFLSAIEESDVAVELGQWVLEAALKQLEAWKSQGLRIPVSVNVSARHLQQLDFMERLEGCLRAHPDANPRLLELEVLETSTLQDVPHVSKIIEACAQKGISIAIDDFGTGYSSLTYLKRLPAQVLKIDKSFVCDMLEDPEDLAILQGILGLANAFRRTPVAEGVETIEHGVLLLKMGCQCGQGYGIARSMPPDDLVDWIRAWKPDPKWARVEQVSPLDWPLLIVEVEMQMWTRVLEGFVAGRRASPPELDSRRCRFGAWLKGEKAGPRGKSETLQKLDQLHEMAHEAARDAVRLHQRGRRKQALTRMGEVEELHQQARAELERLYARPYAEAPGQAEGPAQLQ